MRIGIIGYGHLGKALVRGLILTGFSQNDIDINARTQKTKKIWINLKFLIKTVRQMCLFLKIWHFSLCVV